MVNIVYTKNRCTISILERTTLEEVWTGKKPSVSHMRILGYCAYTKVSNNMRKKLQEKDTRIKFLGYCEGTKAKRLMYLDTKKYQDLNP